MNLASSIAVLVASREHATTLTAVLREAGVPLRGVTLEPLAQRAAVRDLTALTRVLLHGADRTAWLALLRAPWSGLRLAELEGLCAQDQGDFFATLQRRGEHLLLGGDAMLAATRYRGCVGRLPRRCSVRNVICLCGSVSSTAGCGWRAPRSIQARAIGWSAADSSMRWRSSHDEPEGLVGEALGEFCQHDSSPVKSRRSPARWKS